MALETIERLSGSINHQVGGRLRERTSQILSEITGGKYTEVLMDEDFKMSVDTEERLVALERLSRGRLVALERLSRGTLEQIYFALRMAAGELLCGRESFPVILDDVFGMYDEERLCAVLKWLHKEQKQIIISTCHKREMELLERENIPYQKLLLSRMAAGELLCGRESFPVILDDVFGMYDEERLCAVLKWLHKEQKQIIISTCHKREMELLERENIPYQKLLLS